MQYNFLFEDELLDLNIFSKLYLSDKMKTGFIGKMSEYIEKFTPHKKGASFGNKIAIFNKLVKDFYNTLVREEGWDEKDFTNTLYLLAFFETPLSMKNLRTFYTNYKIGLYDYLFEDEDIDWED